MRSYLQPDKYEKKNLSREDFENFLAIVNSNSTDEQIVEELDIQFPWWIRIVRTTYKIIDGEQESSISWLQEVRKKMYPDKIPEKERFSFLLNKGE